MKEQTKEQLFDEIVRVMEENFVAIFQRKDESLMIRSVGGKTYRLTLEEI